MDLRDFITTETAEFAERLTAAAEAATEQLKLEAREAISQLRREAGEVHARLQSETERADSTTAQLEAETERTATLAAQLGAETNRANALASQLETDAARTATIAAELEAETARTATIAAQLETETARVAALAAQVETESARAAALSADLDAANLALREAQEGRLKAEAAQQAAVTELRGVRELLEAARAEATRASDAFQAEAAEKALLQQSHGTIVQDLQSKLDAAAAELSTLRVSLADAAERAGERANASDVELRTLRAQLQEQTEVLGTKDARVEAAEAAVAAMRKQVDEAHAISDGVSAELTAMRERVRGTTEMLNGAATSLDALGSATTVDGVFSNLLRQLAPQFERAAIFRVKGNHLEGEIAAGLDDSVDISKIVIPLGLRSVVTAAVTSRGLEHATKEQIDESRSPFGGSPASALAAPLVFEGEVLAVAYADSNTVFTEAHGPFAGVLARHANAVLAGLAQQVKATRQLRDYARLLLHEAEVMFNGDFEAGVPQHERLQRLRHSIQFAQDLYAQRAALETPVSVDILEEEIAAIAGRDSSTPFAESLALIRQDQGAQRTA